MDNKKFQNIVQNIFEISYYDFNNQTFFDIDPTTSKPITDEQRKIFDIIQTASKTQIFEDLIDILPTDTKINCFFNDNLSDTTAGRARNASARNANIEFNQRLFTSLNTEGVETFIHELTHIVQHSYLRQKNNKLPQLLPKDTFMLNYLDEAEASLNSQIAIFELFYDKDKHPFKTDIELEALVQDTSFFTDIKNRLFNGWNYKKKQIKQYYQYKTDDLTRSEEFPFIYINNYREYRCKGLEHADAVMETLREQYRDLDWLDAYKNQAFPYTRLDNCLDINLILPKYKERIGISDTELNELMSINNIKFKEIIATLHPTAQKYINDASESKFIYDTQGNLIEKRLKVGTDELLVKYDAKGEEIVKLKKTGTNYTNSPNQYSFSYGKTYKDITYWEQELSNYNDNEVCIFSTHYTDESKQVSVIIKDRGLKYTRRYNKTSTIKETLGEEDSMKFRLHVLHGENSENSLSINDCRGYDYEIDKNNNIICTDKETEELNELTSRKNYLLAELSTARQIYTRTTQKYLNERTCEELFEESKKHFFSETPKEESLASRLQALRTSTPTPMRVPYKDQTPKTNIDINNLHLSINSSKSK